MKRALLLAAGAVVVLGAVASIVIALVTPAGPSTSGAPAASPEPAPRGLAALPVVSPEVLARPEVVEARKNFVAQPPGPPVVYGPPRVEAPEGSWEAVPAASRPGEIGPLGPAIGRELNELHDKLGTCYDDDVQARHGGGPVSAVQGFASIEDSAVPVLMLEIETGHDEVRIVDAPVEVRANAEDGLIACAQRFFRGRKLPASGARPGSRYRLMYQLIP